ncbi:glycosyltransferase family 61 protein [Chamaesiphon sp. OTE_75_metabat_556]|uniref:glycosyltransferase family 61 protein n=1 Tax=Chamaesiphon sp. OTE_75_metabat_556 TaxID=2964692 RepID=UPI00286D5E0F|nr:glycosyltransferase family 61 protein [Chamaesiphon sp. OTE_75_metabat_556]
MLFGYKFLSYDMFERVVNKILRIFEELFTPEIEGISINDVKFFREELIFPEEKFELPERLDIFGQKHDYFSPYTITIPPFYVRSIKNAKCVVGREEIFTNNDEVIIEQTPQKVNPWIGRHNWKLKKPVKVKGSVVNLALSTIENNYYHWLTECLGHYYLLEKSQFKPDFYILSNEKSFQKQYLKLLKIDEKRIIKIDSGVVIQADETIVPSLINTSENWDYVNTRGYTCYRKKWLPSWIGNLYRKSTDLAKSHDTKSKIYISRAFADYRKIENEDKIIDLLKSRGYSICHLECMAVLDQIELFSNASIVLGVHGAGFSNIYFCPQNAKVFELFTEYYHDSSFKVLTNALGLEYYYMIGKTNKIEDVHPQKENVYIDLAKLEMALDILEASSSSNN